MRSEAFVPRMLSREEIEQRRRRIECEYGTMQDLEHRRRTVGLSVDQRIALEDLQDLEYLES